MALKQTMISTSASTATRRKTARGIIGLCCFAIIKRDVITPGLAVDKIICRSNYQNKGIGQENSLDTRQINFKLQKPDPAMKQKKKAINSIETPGINR